MFTRFTSITVAMLAVLNSADAVKLFTLEGDETVVTTDAEVVEEVTDATDATTTADAEATVTEAVTTEAVTATDLIEQYEEQEAGLTDDWTSAAEDGTVVDMLEAVESVIWEAEAEAAAIEQAAIEEALEVAGSIEVENENAISDDGVQVEAEDAEVLEAVAEVATEEADATVEAAEDEAADASTAEADAQTEEVAETESLLSDKPAGALSTMTASFGAITALLMASAF